MPFCQTCGGELHGRFCERCGASAAGTAPLAPATTQPAPAKGKTSPIVWILLAFGVIVLLFVGAITVGGFFLVHKARQAGLDPALWQRNPGLAVTKLLTAANPDAEIVSMDERGGVVVVRDKKTGKTVRMNFADIKSGRMSIEADGEKVDIAGSANGDTSALEFKSKDGVARIAAGGLVKLPSWLPPYTGAKDAGGITSSGPNGESGNYGFKTSDSPARVFDFYESALKTAGFTIGPRVQSAKTDILSAESAAATAQVVAATDDGQTSVTISFSPKNK